MDEFEERLARFRRAKAAEAEAEREAARPKKPTPVNVLRSFFAALIPKGSEQTSTETNSSNSNRFYDPSPTIDDEPVDLRFSRTNLLKIGLAFLLWAIFFVIFIKLEFGAVYFIVTTLIAIYLNTGRRKPGTKSAYSVFNPNVERLHGQVTAEQLQQNMFTPLS